MPKSLVSRNNSGFTLIELIMVIVLLGILGAMGADFISQAFKGFAASDRRLEMYEEGKLALARLERELHIALPNAISVPNAEELRFGMIDEQTMAMQPLLGRYQEEDPAGGKTITDHLTASPPPPGTVISIYNRNWSDFTAADSNLRRLYNVTANIPPLSKPVIAGSPYRRYYPVDRIVRYDLNGTTLRRATIAITDENANLTTFTTTYPLVKIIKAGSLRFSYSPATLTRNAVVSVTFTLARDGEEVAFHKEIHIRNVP